jgi:hypothetical protein
MAASASVGKGIRAVSSPFGNHDLDAGASFCPCARSPRSGAGRSCALLSPAFQSGRGAGAGDVRRRRHRRGDDGFLIMRIASTSRAPGQTWLSTPLGASDSHADVERSWTIRSPTSYWGRKTCQSRLTKKREVRLCPGGVIRTAPRLQFSGLQHRSQPARPMSASGSKPENMCSRRAFPSLTQAV